MRCVDYERVHYKAIADDKCRCCSRYSGPFINVFLKNDFKIIMKKILSFCLALCLAKETKTVTFDNFAVVQWSYNVEDVLNPNSTLRFEILTEQNQFSFGWNR